MNEEQKDPKEHQSWGDEPDSAYGRASFAPCYVCTSSSRAETKITKHINARCALCGTIDPTKVVPQAWNRGEPVWVIECPLGTRLQSGPFETRAEAVNVAEAMGVESVAVRLTKGERDFLEVPQDGVIGHGFYRLNDSVYEGPFPGPYYRVEVPFGSVGKDVLDLLRLLPPGDHMVKDIAKTVALWRGQ